MRFARATAGNETVFGVVQDDQLVDLRESFTNVIELVELSMSESGRSTIDAALVGAPSIPLDRAVMLPPIEAPKRILCVGTNYSAHVAESDTVTEAPGHPMIFTRFASSLVGHNVPIERPHVSSNFDYEGELAIVIGRTTRYANRDTALDAIAGYSLLMDGTLRDYQRHTKQFTPGKNFERSGSWGPHIVTADEVGDPYELELSTTVDDMIVQSASTTQLIFDLEAIVSYCSAFTTLEPGDVIATGTPGGVGYARDPQLWLEPGMTVTVEVPGVGTLTNPVIDEQL